MALGPYRPPPSQRYRDELDRQIDQHIDKALHRWNWKLVRFFRTAGIILLVLFLAPTAIIGLLNLLMTIDMGTFLVQLAVAGLGLFLFIGLLLLLGYHFLARVRIYWLKPGEAGVSFADYKGNPEVLEAAKRIATLLRGVKALKGRGCETSRGVLLVGPPGAGKRYLAQAIATEAGVPLGYLSAASLASAWAAMGNIKVMNLYRKARRLSREYGACILFIDEIDAIGGAPISGAAGMGAGGPAEGRANAMVGTRGLLNELLLQMDPPPQEVGWFGKLLRLLGRRQAELPPVLTVGATNLATPLDAALLRPGRFDRKITIDRPDSAGRREIIEYYLGKVKHEPLPIDRMASDTIGYTPQEIKYVINEAVIHAHLDQRQTISYWDFTQARESHEIGLRQPIRGMSYEERRRIAYHEAGHAYATAKLLKKERPTKVTIVRHSGEPGLAAWKPEDERRIRTRGELLNRMQSALASRAAEELFLGTQLSGVADDLASATAIAALMIGAYGMDGSYISYLPMGPDALIQAATSSPDLKARVDAMLNEEYRKVKRLLDNNNEAVTAIAEALILRNELTDLDVDEILVRVEAEHPFVAAHETRVGMFGFKGQQALPALPSSRRVCRPGDSGAGVGSAAEGD